MRLCLTQWLLPSLVDHQARLIDTTPSLHPHYRTSSLLRVVPPLCPASVLSLLWVLHLSFSLNIRTTASHVPHESLDQVHATFMPDATQAVSRFPPGLSWGQDRPPVSTSSTVFRHLISGSLALVSLTQTCHDLVSQLFLNAHHPGSLPEQLKVV